MMTARPGNSTILTQRLSILVIGIALFALPTGCGEDGLLGVSPDIVVEIELAPTAAAGQALVVDFSDVVVTNTAKRNLILSNKGRRSLQISDAKYTGDKSFSYSKLPTALGQGETGKVIAAFAPTEVGEFTGTLVLTTNDPDAKAVTITFKGTGADPNVLVCTPPLDVTEDNCKPGKRVLDFGPTIEKFSRKRFLRIGAIGGSDVLLSSATVSNVEGPKCAKAALDQAFVTDAVDNPTRVESLSNWPLGITFNRQCVMGVRGEHKNVFYALGYSGHGVALANLAGEVLCDLYSDHAEPWADLPFYRNSPLWIPPEPFRWVGYHVVAGLTGKSPRRHS